MNITEDYVSFEIAKLLKEKGFDAPVNMTYDTKGIIAAKWIDPSLDYISRDWMFPRVTHQMALKWLREVHKYLIVVGNKNGNYLYLIKDLKANTDLGISNDEYITYEEAVEAAIKYCLTNLIK